MNRITTCIALLLALGLAVAGTACSGDDDPQTDNQTESSADLTDAEKKAAQVEQTSGPTGQSTSTTATTDKATLSKSCATCGPLPDPWAKGPLPDPWTGSSSGTTTTNGTDSAGHSTK